MKKAPNPTGKRGTGGFKKGVSGNPGGQPKVSAELAKIKDYTNAEHKKIIAKTFRMNRLEILALAESNNDMMIEVVVARALQVAAKLGDVARLNPLVERVCGKVKEQIEISDNRDSEVNEALKDVPYANVIDYLRNTIKAA